MRLLSIVHNHSSLHVGGTELVAEALHQCYADVPGVEATLMAAVDPTQRPGLPGTCISAAKDDPSVFLFRAPGFDVMGQSRFSLEPLLYDFKWFLEERRPDIVHIHHFNHFGVEILALIRSVRPRAKIIVTLHDYYLICANDGLMYTTGGERCRAPVPSDCSRCFPDRVAGLFASRKLFIQKHLELADCLVAPSDFLRQRFVDWGIPASRIKVVRNGWTTAAGAGDDPIDIRRFALLGNLRLTKGTLVALEAFLEAIRRTGADDQPPTLDVFGAPLYQPDGFKDRVRDLVDRADGAIRMRGVYRHEEVGDLLRSIAWVVVPSLWWENAPLVINEAFNLGRPVLCSDVGGMAEAVRDRCDGLHVRAGDVHAWTDAILEASGNRDLWDQMNSQIQSPRSPREAAEEYLSLIDRHREVA